MKRDLQERIIGEIYIYEKRRIKETLDTGRERESERERK